MKTMIEISSFSQIGKNILLGCLLTWAMQACDSKDSDGIIPVNSFVVSTLAGGVEGHNDGKGAEASFRYPSGIAVDLIGNIYVADSGNERIRKITPDGVVTTLAGSSKGDADGQGTNAKFNSPQDVAVDKAGNVYVADYSNHKIRKITPDGMVSTVAGSGPYSDYADGPGISARFHFPNSLTLDNDGNIYVADDGNYKIRVISQAGTVTTLAGSTAGFEDGPGNSAKFFALGNLAIDKNGDVLLADISSSRIRKISLDGTVTTFAGESDGHIDGPISSSRFSYPIGIAMDSDGVIFISEGAVKSGTGETFWIRRIETNGDVSTIAGGNGGLKDGAGLEAQFNYAQDIAVDLMGNIYVADVRNNLIRKIIKK